MFKGCMFPTFDSGSCTMNWLYSAGKRLDWQTNLAWASAGPESEADTMATTNIKILITGAIIVFMHLCNITIGLENV